MSGGGSLFANPDVVGHSRYVDTPGMSTPVIEMPTPGSSSEMYNASRYANIREEPLDQSSRGGGYEDEDDEDGGDEEYEYEEDEDGQDNEQDPGQGQGQGQGQEFRNPDRLPLRNPASSSGTVPGQSQAQAFQGSMQQPMQPPGFFDPNIRDQEMIDLLIRLRRIIERRDDISKLVPNKIYNLQTSYFELKNVVDLCEGVLAEKKRAQENRNGKLWIFSGMELVAGGVEYGNAHLIPVDKQFAADGYRDTIKHLTKSGDVDDIAEQVWELFKPKLGFTAHPVVMLGAVMAKALADHVKEMEKQYKSGNLPDPRKERMRLKMEKEAQEAEGDYDDEYEGEEGGGGGPQRPYQPHQPLLVPPQQQRRQDNRERASMITQAIRAQRQLPATVRNNLMDITPMAAEDSDDTEEDSDGDGTNMNFQFTPVGGTGGAQDVITDLRIT